MNFFRFIAIFPQRGYIRAGFSLLEVVLVVVLIGIISGLTLPVFTTVLRGAVSGGVELEAAEEAYWAVGRMVSIIGTAVDVDVSNAQSPRIATYDAVNSSTNWRAFSFSNGSVTYEGDLFWDNVDTFNCSYADRLFRAEMKIVDAAHPEFTVDIHVRNAQ